MDRLNASRQSLTEALRSRGLVLVTGPEAVQVELRASNGFTETQQLYALVAAKLLDTYAVEPPAGPDRGGSTWHVHRAVDRIMATNAGISTERVRRSVSALVNEVSRQYSRAQVLDRLANLRAFDLIVCLTPDDLLVNALKKAYGEKNVEVIAYSPYADSSQAADVSSPRPGLVRVFYPLGRSATGTRVAVHEEDALEYLFKFQEDATRRAPNLLAALRANDLLMLGCDLPDWLGRSFLRLANESRLSSPDKKMEFFAADAKDPGFTGFLQRFDPNCSIFPWSPDEFVAELENLLPESGDGAVEALRAQTSPGPAKARGAPTAFISYASENVEPARALADTLLELGFGDVWFDKKKLISGDDWSSRIEEAIQQCDFFVPILSMQADDRREGVFWQEWRWAIARAMHVNDAFLLPIGIDDVDPNRVAYRRIFSSFTSSPRVTHVLHAPLGRLPVDAASQLRERVRRYEANVDG